MLAVPGTLLLMVQAQGDPKKLIAFAIYGLSLILLFLASSIYHSLRSSESGELVLRKLDHAGILLMFPFACFNSQVLRGPSCWFCKAFWPPWELEGPFYSKSFRRC
jgi:hemolysin III